MTGPSLGKSWDEGVLGATTHTWQQASSTATAGDGSEAGVGAGP